MSDFYTDPTAPSADPGGGAPTPPPVAPQPTVAPQPAVAPVPQPTAAPVESEPVIRTYTPGSAPQYPPTVYADARGSRPKRPRRRFSAGWATVVVILVVVGASAVVPLISTARQAHRLSQSLHSNARCPGGGSSIDCRAGDPDPIGDTEFAEKLWTLNDHTYRLLGHDLHGSCPVGVGVAAAGCTQVARATYLTHRGDVVVGALVFNLSKKSDASDLADALDRNPNTVRPLETTSGPHAHRGGLERPIVSGHYLAVVVAQNTDGSKASDADDSPIGVAMHDIAFGLVDKVTARIWRS